ncbi:MAG: endolytic transglycosylase MltG [Candidatus Eisenbacteria bacterium]|nr:endolytic transglycosylase MltG [Candidatus Eisenbacteria bacterium]
MTAARRRGAFRPIRWAWLLLLAALLAPAYELLKPAGFFPPDERRTVIIERGQSLHEIAQELRRAGVIRGTFGFLALARIMHLDRTVKAGQYAFRLGMTVPEILRALDRGMFGLDLLTLPEGLTVREVAEKLGARLGVPAATIDSLSRDSALLDSLGVDAPSLEGYLAPDSYEWLPGTAPEVALRTMVRRTLERVQKATAGCDSMPLGFGTHELLTMASIVEAEAQMDDERPRIARAYLNRLVKGMKLQADPTVGYALGRNPRSRLTLRELRVESAYNTYLHAGLPPGPICNPGQASIEAVINATPGTNDLYFVARGDGRHMFAATYEQHLANITAARALQAAYAARAAAAAAAADSGAVPALAEPAAAAAAPDSAH